MSGECVRPSALEAMAQGGAIDSASRAHLAQCERCRTLLDEIRENLRFLERAGAALRNAADASTTQALPDGGLAVPGYDLLSEISRGGQGVVYRAVQTATRRAAAVKMMLAGAFATARQTSRFDREIEIAARLRHPNIVTVFESGVTADGHRYVAMEFIEGVPLDEHIRARRGACSARAWIAHVAQLMARVASAVGHAHVNGVIHRDIKPSNILVDAAGVPHVLDFGLARDAPGQSEATLTREFAGTPAYASPEQFADDPSLIDARTDVYSLGVVLYAALTGTHPYPCSGSIASVIENVRTTDPARPSSRVPRIPADLDVITLKALAKDRTRRYPSAQALCADLEDYLAGRPISARRDSALYVLSKLAQKHRTPVAAAGAVLIVMIAALAGLSVMLQKLNAQRRVAENALAESNLQRGRLLAKVGSLLPAERLLWKEAISAGLGPLDQLGLEASPKARRVAWALLELYASAPRRLLTRSAGRPVQVGLSDDRSEVWCVSLDGAYERWSLDGTRVRHAPAFLEAQTDSKLAASTNGRRAAFGRESQLEFIEIDARRTMPEPVMLPSPIESISTNDRGHVFACTDRRGQASLVEWGSSVVRPLPGAGYSSVCVDQGVAAAAQAGGMVRLFALDDGRPLGDLRLPGELLGSSAFSHAGTSISPDGLVAVVQCQASLSLFKLRPEPELVLTQKSHSPFSIQPRFAADGRSIVTTCNDGAITHWSIPDLEPMLQIRGSIHVSASAFCDPVLITGHSDETVAVWQLSDRPWPRRFPATSRSTHGLALSPEGDLLAAGNDAGVLQLVRVANGESVAQVAAHSAMLTSIDFSASGETLVTAGMDGVVREWTRSGQTLGEIGSGLGAIWCVQHSPDGRWIAASTAAGKVFLWNATERGARPQAFEDHVARVPQIAFSPDGRRLASLSFPGDLIVRNVEDGSVCLRLRKETGQTRTLAFAPDGGTLAVGADDRTIHLYDARSGELRRTFADLPWGVFDLQFHSSGRVLFAVGRGSEIIAVDVETGALLATFPAHERLVFKLRLDRDGRRLFTTGEDDWIGVWDLDHLRDCVAGNASFHYDAAGGRQ